MKILKKAGSTSEIWQVFIQDSSSTTGAGLTGLVFNTSGLTAYYHRDTDTTATAMTLVTMTVGTYTSLGFKEVDATNMPGWYQLCPPTAVLAASAKSVGLHLKGAANMAPLAIEVQLTLTDPDTATTAQTGDSYARLGAPAGASVSADIAAAKVDTAAIKVQTDKLAFTVANQVDSNVIDWKGATAPAMTGDSFARLGAPAGASHAADVAAVKTDTAAVKVQTDKLTFTVANQVDSNTIDWKGATAPAMTGDAFARLGAPVGASHSADVAAVQTSATAIKAKTDSLTFTVALQADVNVVDWKGATAAAMTGDAFARLGAPAGASASADIAAAKVDTAAIKVQTDKLAFTVANQVDSNVIDWKGATAPAMTGDAFARLGAPVGASISADVAGVVAAMFAGTVEGSTTFVQALRLYSSVLAGKTNKSGTTRNFRDLADSKNRVAATVDATTNDRTAVTLILT